MAMPHSFATTGVPLLILCAQRKTLTSMAASFSLSARSMTGLIIFCIPDKNRFLRQQHAISVFSCKKEWTSLWELCHLTSDFKTTELLSLKGGHTAESRSVLNESHTTTKTPATSLVRQMRTLTMTPYSSPSSSQAMPPGQYKWNQPSLPSLMPSTVWCTSQRESHTMFLIGFCISLCMEHTQHVHQKERKFWFCFVCEIVARNLSSEVCGTFCRERNRTGSYLGTQMEILCFFFFWFVCAQPMKSRVIKRSFTFHTVDSQDRLFTVALAFTFLNVNAKLITYTVKYVCPRALQRKGYNVLAFVYFLRDNTYCDESFQLLVCVKASRIMNVTWSERHCEKGGGGHDHNNDDDGDNTYSYRTPQRRPGLQPLGLKIKSSAKLRKYREKYILVWEWDWL